MGSRMLVCLMLVYAAGCKTVEKAKDALQDATNVVSVLPTTTQPTTTTQPAAIGPATDVVSVAGSVLTYKGGKTPSLVDIPITSRLISATLHGAKGIDYRFDSKLFTVSNSRCVLLVMRDGRLTGGMYDWMHPVNMRDWKNVTRWIDSSGKRHDSLIGLIPDKGEDIWACIQLVNGSQRTQVEYVGKFPIDGHGW